MCAQVLGGGVVMDFVKMSDHEPSAPSDPATIYDTEAMRIEWRRRSWVAILSDGQEIAISAALARIGVSLDDPNVYQGRNTVQRARLGLTARFTTAGVCDDALA